MPFDFENSTPVEPAEEAGFDFNNSRVLERRNDYIPLPPDGKSESIFLESENKTVTVPSGTSEELSFLMNDDLFEIQGDSTALEETAAQFEKQAAYITFIAAAFDLVPDDQVSGFIASRGRALAAAQASQPEYMKKFNREWEAADGFFSGAGVVFDNKRALGRTTFVQSANAALPLLTTFAGAGAGTAMGGPVGAVAGSAAGAFVGGSAVEVGAEIDGMLSELGYDTSKEGDVLAALSDPDVIRDVKIKAAKKGLTTAAVDAMFQLVGGRFLKMAKVKGGGAITRVGAGAADVGVQAAGEGIGEAAGQLAGYGEVDIKDAVLESITSLGQSAGQTAIGTGTGVVAPNKAVNVENLEEEVEQQRQELESLEIFQEQGLPERMVEPVKQQITQKRAAIEQLESAVKIQKDIIAAQQEDNLLPVPKSPETLAKFLRDKGGLILDGETSRFSKKKNPNLRGVAKKTGKLTLAQARVLAVEAGFIKDSSGDFVSESTIQDLVDALEAESVGNPVVRDEDVGLLQEINDISAFNEERSAANTEIQATTKTISTVKQAFAKGVSSAKKDVAAVQTAVIGAIEKSGIPKDERAKFIRSIKNIQTFEQLEKKAPEIEKRLTEIVEDQAKKKFKKQIKKALKGAKVRKKSGKPAGKFTPEIQKTLNDLIEISKLTQEKAEEMQTQILEATQSVPTPEEKLQLLALDIQTKGASASIEDLTRYKTQIDSITTLGKSINEALASEKLERLNEDIEELQEMIGDRKPVKPKKFFSKVSEAVGNRTTGGFNSWFGTFRTKLLTAFDHQDIGRVEDFLEKLDLFDESRAYDVGRREQISKVQKIMAERTGMSQRKLLKKLMQDSSKTESLGIFEHSDGITREVKFTRSELRKMWMNLQNEDLKQSMMHKKSNAYTQDVIDAIENAMTEEDVQIALSQLQYYNDYYKRINAVYRKLYNIDLPQVKMYSPIRRSVVDGESSEFLKGLQYSGSVSPSSLKSRTDNVEVVSVMGDFETLISHTMEMEYFLAYAEKVHYLRRMFSNRDVKRLIEDKYGVDVFKSFIKDIEFFERKGRQSSVLNSKALKALVRNFGFAQLAAKPQIGLKQLTSFPAMISGVKTKDFIAGLVSFAANPKKAYDVLQGTEFFSGRGNAIDKDFQAMVNDPSKLNFLGKRPNLLGFLMMPIRLGDKGAILVGGYAHYYAKRKAGRTHEQAIKSATRLANRTQQSSDIDQFSELQADSGVMSQILTQFMTSPNALARAEYEAIINIVKGRGTKAEMIKRLFVYHVLIPNLFMLAANGFQWESEDQLQASVLGQTVGLFLFGEVIESAVSAAIKDDYFESKIRHPLEFTEDMIDFLSDASSGDVSLEDFIDGTTAVNKGLRGISQATGFPVQTIYNEMMGLKDMAEGDAVRGAYKALGYSPYVVDNKIMGGGGSSKNMGFRR